MGIDAYPQERWPTLRDLISQQARNASLAWLSIDTLCYEGETLPKKKASARFACALRIGAALQMLPEQEAGLLHAAQVKDRPQRSLPFWRKISMPPLTG